MCNRGLRSRSGNGIRRLSTGGFPALLQGFRGSGPSGLVKGAKRRSEPLTGPVEADTIAPSGGRRAPRASGQLQGSRQARPPVEPTTTIPCDPPDTAVEPRLVGEVDAWLVEALATLSARQRTAVALRHVEDLDLRQIAERMGPPKARRAATSPEAPSDLPTAHERRVSPPDRSRTDERPHADHRPRPDVHGPRAAHRRRPADRRPALTAAPAPPARRPTKHP